MCLHAKLLTDMLLKRRATADQQSADELTKALAYTQRYTCKYIRVC